MSYLAVDQLSNDTAFAGRNRACCMEQAETFKDDTRADIVAVADAILRDEGGLYLTFTRMAAAGPGIGDKADNGDGTIDQSKIGDDDILALTQANWPVVAGLYFATDGTPIP